jgi:hypothetical protein
VLKNHVSLALTDEDKLKEQIRFNTEIAKLFVITLIGTIGGIVSLLLEKVNSGIEYVFLIGGMFIAPTCIVVIKYLYSITQKLIRNGKLS